MSDALLTEISKKLSDIHAALKGGSGGAVTNKGATAGGASKPDKPTAGAATQGGKPAAGKPAAGKPGATAGATKASGGKYTADQVKDIVRKVATTDGLGKESALAVLDENGGGVKSLNDLKPEFFDAVYEACQVELNNNGGGAGEEDDLGL